MKDQMRVTFWVITVLLFFTISGCWYSIRKTQRNAQRFFQRALLLQIGQATEDDVLRLVYSSHGGTYGFEPCISGGADCIGTIYFDNTWLRRLHLAPPAAFACRFGVENRKLHNRWCEMFTVAKSGEYLNAFVNEAKTTRWRSDEIDQPLNERFFKVRMFDVFFGAFITPETPQELRKLAYNFNFNCLSKIRGCKSYEELLPILARKDLVGPHPELH